MRPQWAPVRCVGCGWCCRTGPCAVALLKVLPLAWPFSRGWVCPALAWDGRRHLCHWHGWRQAFKAVGLIGYGEACIMRNNPWRFGPLCDRTGGAGRA